MFVLLTLSAMFCYALQGALLAGIYRRVDPLSVVAWRGLSLAVTMVPLIFLSHPLSMEQVYRTLPLITLSAFLMVGANLAVAMAFRSLSVGLTSTFCMSFMAIASCFISVFLLKEPLSLYEVFWIAVIISGLIQLGLSGRKVKEGNAPISLRGVICCLLHGLIAASGFFMLTLIVREESPFLAAYMWEALIGLFAAAFAACRKLLGKEGLYIPNYKTLGKISAYSFPTVAGTACFTVAITLGPFSIAAVILSIGLVVSYMLGWLFYQEKISPTQVVISLVVLFALIFLQL